MTRIARTLTIALLLVLSACADDPQQKSNNGFDVGEQPDAGDMGMIEDTGTQTDMGVEGTITFSMTNATTQTIYAGISGGRASCAPFPFLKIEGADVTPRLQQDCATCVCGEDACAVCDCAIPDRSTYALEPGATREFTWDKMFWEVGFENDRSCQSPRPATGVNYLAEFCFSDDYDEETQRPSRQLCDTVEFGINDETVNFTVEDEVLPTNETDLSILNSSDQTIYVRPNPGQCHGTWFSLNANGEPLSLYETCDVCNCSEGTECTVACPAAACAPPMLADFEVPVGESRTFNWDHTHWPQRTLGEDVCEYPDYIAPGTTVTAELCFSKEVIENGQFVEIGEEACETVEFTTDEATVEYVVE